ncbi:translocation/assembly module TamB domain-containing protein [Roseixanthobacter glucoisosaccharinicivorans]|uniref:translocation/assembly module TamB domain-containing protein n=1 Tax=Roseixanthobacter glucoisosaccharinicivorans TaxID=3119923 RepID=UPI00372C4A80
MALFSRILKGIAQVVAVALIAVVAFALLAFGIVQTPPGKAFLARFASELASTNGLRVTLTGLTGFVPGDIALARVELADPKGNFLELEDLRLRWSPLALLSGTVDVALVQAARVNVLRAPDLPAPASPSGKGGGVALRVIVDRLALDRIDLAEPVLGRKAQLQFEGGLRLMEPAKGISLKFDLERRDEPGSVGGSIRYVPEARTLDLDLTAREPAGGLVARMAALEGLPPLDAQVKGSGPLEKWSGTLNATAGSVLRLEGTADIVAQGTSHLATLALTGDLQKALPANVASLFAGRTELAAAVLVDPALTVSIRRFTLASAGLSATLGGTFQTAEGTADVKFSATAGDSAAFSVLLPGIGWRALTADGMVSGPLAAPRARVTASAQGITGAGYGAQILTLTARTTDDGAGGLTFRADAAADGLSAADPAVAKALGPRGTLALSGVLPQVGAPEVRDLAVALNGLDLKFTGRAGADMIDGTVRMPRLDLAALAPLAHQPLRGVIALDAEVKRVGSDGAIALKLNGSSRDVETGIAAADGLVGGAAQVAGGLSYAGDGALTVQDLKLDAAGVTLAVNGKVDRRAADLIGEVALRNLSRLDSRLEGAANGRAAFSGTLDALNVTARLSVDQGKAMGQPISGLTLDADLKDLTGRIGGNARLAGQVGGKPARGSATLATGADGSRALSGLDFAVGSVSAQGALIAAASGLLTGQVSFSAGNLADVSAFALTELAGRAEGNIVLDEMAGTQRIALRADLDNVLVAGQRVQGARIDLSIADPRAGTGALRGTVDATGISSGSLQVSRARIVASEAGGGTALTLNADAQGATIAAAGRLTASGQEQAFRLDTLRIARTGTNVTLSAPATVTVRDGTVAVDRFALATGGGTVTVQGSAGDALDLTVDIRALPLALAALADPALNLSGTVNASARITGPATAPTGRYDLTVLRATSPDIARAGAGPFDLRANGTLDGGSVRIASTISGPALSGVAINGTVPFQGNGLDLSMRGNISLAIANALLATSGARATGTAAVDATVRGSLADPRAGGTVRISGGRYEDAVNGVTLDRIQAVVTGTDRSVTLSSFQAATLNGGSIQGNGSVTLDPAAGFPGRLDLTLNNAGLVNSEIVRFVADGQIAIGGAFATRPTIGGQINVRALDINIPDRLPGGARALNVRHVNVPPGKTFTVPPVPARRPGGRGQDTRAAAFLASLDLSVNAPNRVFVRGMGVDAELSGTLNVRGTSAAPVTVGGFELLRGRFDIIGRRLDFTRGRVTFNGTTDPDLDFIAESTANDVTARVTISGRASQPEITFSSTPTLPQDEVVARLLFGRSAGQLSAGQALQVAQTVATLSGSGNAALSSLRRSLGVDSLDVGTNADGTGGQLGIGKRLNDRIYLGVRQGTTSGSSAATVDIDITRNIRLQGATGADGGTEVGIGAQWDY